mmetsp:Transcript_24393/g.76013  ORF Transcript_24393/g.76013 Transcript_24393/m.76013 type:complete len:201 (+) Transcript_24393:1694-2296(+)
MPPRTCLTTAARMATTAAATAMAPLAATTAETADTATPATAAVATATATTGAATAPGAACQPTLAAATHPLRAPAAAARAVTSRRTATHPATHPATLTTTAPSAHMAPITIRHASRGTCIPQPLWPTLPRRKRMAMEPSQPSSSSNRRVPCPCSRWPRGTQPRDASAEARLVLPTTTVSASLQHSRPSCSANGACTVLAQ